MAWAAWNGIVNGYSATTFGPQDRVTREQLAAILYRYAAYKGCEVSQRGDLTQFVDAGQIHTYAREALSWANRMELIQGKGKGILDPRGLAARAPGGRHAPAVPGKNSGLRKRFAGRGPVRQAPKGQGRKTFCKNEKFSLTNSKTML